MSKASRGELSTAAQQTRSAPFPLAGEGVGEGWGGGSLLSPEASQPNSSPTPNPSPQGGGESTASVATSRGISAGTRIAPALAHNTGFSAGLRHARYILSENAVTGFAFALFLAIVLAALAGPYLVPYDPLASDTAAALKAPSAAHWFGTDQLGRDVFSRVVVATRLDFFIADASVALVFLMAGLAGVAAGFFGGWTDRVVGRIGLAVRPPAAEWGIMVAEGSAFMVSGEWWMAFFPGAALMVAVFCFNLLGDGLRDIVDPQRRT